ncbi:hypothetical protein LPB142_11420 [Rhodobacter xanthinilyticus]|uniref:Lipoprotein n=1 Tax=Rhodobacter xanthinilyticus TaxID=1850250 RepID=A0A1D9MDA2_9RHOB|nr:hypothetical protein [Rhodobacter xanthinilyticus]AOZ69854.1 hypothetical protein LPB142_11420 [Rhodobacter xanthinilyticus]
MYRFGFIALFALTACAPSVITEYNGHSLRVQTTGAKPTAEAVAEARRICAMQGLQAEYASTQTPPNALHSSHLFLCLPQAKPNAGLPRPGGPARVDYLERTATM